MIRAEREHIDAESNESEGNEAADLLSPEAAVARFLGLAAIAHAGESKLEQEPSEGDKLDADTAMTRSKKALTEAAARTGRFSGSYCRDPLDNLVDSLTLGQARTALENLKQGDGGELNPQASGAPKFCAAYSSAALAVNSFAACWGGSSGSCWTASPGFERLEFEVKFPTCLQGKPPNLDVAASGPRATVAIESKCLEYLGEHEAMFQPSYSTAVRELAHESWAALFDDLKNESGLLSRLGVGQLVRHYLGLRRAVVEGLVPAATLLYIYWEPADAERLPAFRDHRADLAKFDSRVSDPTVRFASLSYPDLWAQWSADGAPGWLEAHVDALRERYEVSW